MTNKTKMSTGIVAVVLLLGVGGGALAYDQTCTTPEAQALRKLAQYDNSNDPAVKAKLAGLPIVEREEARICALRNLTPQETAAIVAMKKSMEGMTSVPAEENTLQPITLGIQGPVSPTVSGRGLMPGINGWKGYVNGTLVSITGTAEKDDPYQGVLFVWEPGAVTTNFESIRTYQTPSATGPLKIVSESNGVITAASLAGSYEAYDMDTSARHNVTTTGSTTYTFDLTSRSFK